VEQLDPQGDPHEHTDIDWQRELDKLVRRRQIMVRANIDESRWPWRRERPTDDLPDQGAREPTPVEERSALFDALQGLPEQQRKWSCCATGSGCRCGDGERARHQRRDRQEPQQPGTGGPRGGAGAAPLARQGGG
jgi:hypothetical protein